MLSSLKASSTITDPGMGDDEFDLLIIGGGATGAGVAVDAASRGLKIALVEQDDFSAGGQIIHLHWNSVWLGRRLIYCTIRFFN
jgi:2-polyprenyl-6-methoxyphenol hydroxylase-like FAD-dependent oxidoreductase